MVTIIPNKPLIEDIFDYETEKGTYKIVQFRDFNDYLKGSAVLEETKAAIWHTDMDFLLSRNTFVQ